MARENGETVFLLLPEVWSSRRPSWNRVFWFFRSTQQKYHGIIGVAVDGFAGGGDEVWDQTTSKLKQRFTFGHWEVVLVKVCSREVVQAADGTNLFCVLWRCQWWTYPNKHKLGM